MLGENDMVDNRDVAGTRKETVEVVEALNIEKIHEMVEYACEDISGVSSSQVEMS
jgi:hypothetical protein